MYPGASVCLMGIAVLTRQIRVDLFVVRSSYVGKVNRSEAHANRRLPTTLHISELHHAASLLATPGFVRPLAGRHAGSLLTGWLDVRQGGLAPQRSHLLGNNNQFHRISPTPKVSGLPWREQAVVRQGPCVMCACPRVSRTPT